MLIGISRCKRVVQVKVDHWQVDRVLAKLARHARYRLGALTSQLNKKLASMSSGLFHFC